MGKPIPEYVTGDECLFCHRNDVGPSWSKNRHQRTIREVETGSASVVALNESADYKQFAKDVTLQLGGDRCTRFAKRSKAYGKLDLLNVARDASDPGKGGKLRALDGKARWDTTTFAESCAGCHATGVDSASEAFSVVALDCVTCHGVVPAEHSKDTKLVYFSKKREDPARVVTSICASCHIRSGKSKSTGRPYPNNFVAGDNLFRDFQVDLSATALAGLNPADRHVLENVRDVVVLGKDDVTCVSCHDVHKRSSKKHAAVAENDSCVTCHNETGSKKKRKTYEVHSKTCQY